jgi:hypothetical protein
MLEASPYMADRSTIEELSQAEVMTGSIEDYGPGGKRNGLRPLDRAWEKYGSIPLDRADRVSVAPVFHGKYMAGSQKLIDASNKALERSKENPYVISGKGGTEAGGEESGDAVVGRDAYGSRYVHYGGAAGRRERGA